MAKVKHKADQRAATRGAGWTGLPHVVHDSTAYLSLSLYARQVLIEVVRRFNGYNNGKIAISQREIGKRLGSSNYTKISKAVAELMDRGMIDVTTNRNWKARMAREYRLTFVSTGDHVRHVQATDDYRYWTAAEKSGADDGSAEEAFSADDVSSEQRNPADDVSSGQIQKWQKRVIRKNVAAEASSSLIYTPYPQPETECDAPLIGWWVNDSLSRLAVWASVINAGAGDVKCVAKTGLPR